MATILMIDNGAFDLTTDKSSPLGGTEAAFIELAKALAVRGHHVWAMTKCERSVVSGNLVWAPIGAACETSPDIIIANRDPLLFDSVKSYKTKEKILWLHNTAQYLLRPKRFLRMLTTNPKVVFLGEYHSSTYPWWAPSKSRHVIPHGLAEAFMASHPTNTPPPPVAVFLSNPLRSLDWLVELWVNTIQPAVPNAELHIYSGPSTYGEYGKRVAATMQLILDKASCHQKAGVVLKRPLPKTELSIQIANARTLLYRSDVAETFCFAVAEAQSLGIPCVVQDLGSMRERILNGATGFIAKTDEEFCERAIDLLTNDSLWSDQHRSCLHRKRRTWDQVAKDFEQLF
jgi:glycosyltransferase involved in cell wall biosynthesis